MNIIELEQYNLADTVKFHDRLNPRLWGRDEHLLPKVQQQLMAIADDFREFLGVTDLDLEDITVSGSNAAYSYTPQSDIDLHLVVRLPQANADVLRELFAAKKYQYNDEHNIRIGGADVELYVQPSDQPHISQGIYSLKNQDWIQIPRRRVPDIDDTCVAHKIEDLQQRIDVAVSQANEEAMQRLWTKIKTMRQTGLEQQGEFGCDNLAFKGLRRSGYLQKLKQAINQAHDHRLSLDERRRKKRSRTRYAYGGYWSPGFAYGDDGSGGGGDGGGGDGGGGESAIPRAKTVNEHTDHRSALQQFVRYVIDRLQIDPVPRILLHKNNHWSEKNHSFGRYDPDTATLHVSLPDRHILDVMRTAAHELVHCHQHQVHNTMPANAGTTGSDWENDANVKAGIIMRDFAAANPDLFKTQPISEGRISQAVVAGVIALAASLSHAQESGGIMGALNTALKLYGISKITEPRVKAEINQELQNYLKAQGGDPGAQNQSWLWQMQKRQNQQQQQQQQQQQPPEPEPQYESASGYIPTKKQARDPRYAMALTVDIKPGEVGRQANKMALQTDAQGRPALLMKTANLRESRVKDLNEPLGPETPPTMPAGTVRVDVSDVYDWYKLGQHISNLKGLGRHDFGKGPPASIISFGDEDTEHKFIKDLKRTGLDVTDIDPADPNQPADMPKIKTDPTYNVDEDRTGNQDTDLVIFDIDDTLMHTTAKIKVIKNGITVRELTNQEFNNYKLKPGEQFDFGEFRSAEKFRSESEPIKPMIRKLKAILNYHPRAKVIMLTARADFDDKQTFLDTFRDLGIDMSRVHVHRAGNLPGNAIPAEKKAVWVRRYLDSGKYNHVRLYDDSMSNLRVFKDLQQEYPAVDFRAIYVEPGGVTRTVEQAVTHVPAAAGCVIVAKNTGRVCLQQRSNAVSDPGLWSCWGGHRDASESLKQCVRRELAEESGYQGPLQLLPLHRTASYATFVGRVPREFEPQINFESQDWGWFEPDQLPRPLHPGLAAALKSYQGS